ncbi:MAG: PQQ-binding-like beta-propeller repeat protein [bacterium]
MKTPAAHTAVLALALSVIQAGATDWPQWGGRNARNFVADETGLPVSFCPDRTEVTNSVTTFVPGENVKWSAPLGTQAYVTPAVAQGKLFIGANDALVETPRFAKTQGSILDCLDEATGQRLWRLVIPQLRTANKLFNYDDLNLGLCSSPTVDGDRVYVVGSRGDVLCLDINGQADGNAGPFTDEGHYLCDTRIFPDKPGRFGVTNTPPLLPPLELQPGDADIVWRYDFIEALDVWPQDAVDCSILVFGDYLFVCTCNGVDKSHTKIPSPQAPDMIVLDKKTGKLVAVIDQPLGHAIFHGDWSSPTLARINGQDLVVWGGGDGICYAFDARFEPGQGNAPGTLKKVWWFDCNPPHNKVKDGKPIPYKKAGEGPSEIIATPVIANSRIYLAVGQDSRHGTGKGCLSCIDATLKGDITETGKIWQCFDVDRSFSSAAVTRDGLVFIADYTGILRCLDADTGKEYWAHDLKGRVFCSPLCADGKVYIGTEAGRLTVASATREKKILSEVRFDGPIYATPVAANGVLYIASQRKLYAFQQPLAQPKR